MGAVGGVVLAKHFAGARNPFVIGDIAPLMPRNRAETAHAALLALNAGLSEELFFRLLLPMLLTIVLGNALCAFVGAAIIFGLVHIYQGWIGVLVTAILGLALTILYLMTQTLWLAIGAHAMMDLLALVVRPTFARLIAR